MTDVLIHSPYPREASQGNSVTADRLERIMSGAGYDVAFEAGSYGGGDARCMIALNARRSASAVMDFQEAFPGRKVVVVLTGTDINHGEMADAESPTRRTMDRADALVVLHEEDLGRVPESLRAKTVCIYPSVELPEGLRHQPTEDGSLRVIMAGNMRPVKNPLLAVRALRLLPVDTPVRISAYGEAGEELAAALSEASRELGHFDWAGRLDHDTLLERMADAHLLLNTSHQEGGANAVCEAITLGLPVVASRVRGNEGMLGCDYPGLFAADDARALADLLGRCAGEPDFYRGLKQAIHARAPLFSYPLEARAWLELIAARFGM